jgi:CheY-like chemotaxis protein
VEDLGLLLTRRFCQGQGGDLSYRVTSSGTWITLFLPVPSAAAGNATPSSAPAKELVLFVGNRAEVIETLWQQLQHSAYQLAVAHGVAEAEGMIQRLQPTVVLGCQQSFPDAMAALRQAAHVSLPHAEIYFRTLSAEADAPEAEASSAEPTVAMTDLKAHLDQLLAASSAQPSRSGLPTLTLLLLPQASQPSEQPPVLTTELQAWLQHYQCRLLQVDDLPQARVMSRVWQPDALLIDTSLPISPEDWQALTQAPEMALLPVVMLTAHGPWGHNHQHGLRVYYCPIAGDLSAEQNALSLIRTIETALGE